MPDFSWYNTPKREKIHQMTTKYTKYTNIFHSNALQNMPKLGCFGMQTYHLATPVISYIQSVDGVYDYDIDTAILQMILLNVITWKCNTETTTL
jgi:hypothetical protein